MKISIAPLLLPARFCRVCKLRELIEFQPQKVKIASPKSPFAVFYCGWKWSEILPCHKSGKNTNNFWQIVLQIYEEITINLANLPQN